jgi:hypothetical protein
MYLEKIERLTIWNGGSTYYHTPLHDVLLRGQDHLHQVQYWKSQTISIS